MHTLFLQEKSLLLTSSKTLYHHPSAVARATFFYAYGAGHALVPSGFRTARSPECNDGFLIVYTVGGSGTLTYRNANLSAGPSSVFFIDCTERFQLQCSPRQNWEFLWVHFDGQNCRGYLYQYTKRKKYFICELSATEVDVNIERILVALESQDTALEYRISHYISGLLTELLVFISDQDSVSTIIPDYIHAVVCEIEDNFQSSLSLQSVAARVGVTKYYLSREFKYFIGQTFSEYLTYTRIEHAKMLLKQTQMPVEQICFACGMKTVSHFINTFKKRESVTPLVYRKRWNSHTQFLQ